MSYSLHFPYLPDLAIETPVKRLIILVYMVPICHFYKPFHTIFSNTIDQHILVFFLIPGEKSIADDTLWPYIVRLQFCSPVMTVDEMTTVAFVPLHRTTTRYASDHTVVICLLEPTELAEG